MSAQCFRCRRPITDTPIKTAWGMMHLDDEHCLSAACASADAAEARAATLAAEVERLTAELQKTTVDRDMELRYADVLKNERDALRAQLDAAQFTYDTDPPVDAQIDAICHEVQMDGRGTWWHGSNVIYPDGWRPAPPQE